MSAEEVWGALAKALDNYLIESKGALDAATVIGQRSCRPGDGLNYSNHDRLATEATKLRALVRAYGAIAQRDPSTNPSLNPNTRTTPPTTDVDRGPDPGHLGRGAQP